MHEIIDWVRANAIPIATIEPGNGFGDLERLRRVLDGSRIVSLGEATHGTREFFQLKHRLLEYCVAELGFTVFGIEASYPECLRVNDYVQHGIGNPSDALAGTRFWTWDTEEVLELIQWIRNWNRTQKHQVKFYGFDMQFPTEAAHLALHYLKRVAPDLAISSEAALWPLCDDLSADRFHLFPDAVCASAFATIERIRDAFLSERTMWVAATSELEWRLARLNVNVLDQSARLRRSTSHAATVSRDIAMAENVAAVLDVEGPQAKAVLWAHNGHVARQISNLTNDKDPPPTMGSRLHEIFGREHVLIGFAFNQGAFQAIERGRGLVDHTVPPAHEGSLDRILAATDIPALLLDLKTVPPSGPVNDWLASRPLARWIGAVYSAGDAEKYLEALDPRCAYDALAFVETTTAARPNKSGRRLYAPDPGLAPTMTNLELAGSGDLPEGWYWSGSRRMHAHRLVILDKQSPSGRRSVRIERGSAPWYWGEGRLEQEISAEAWCRKRLRFGAAVRAEVQGPGTGAHIYIEARPKPPEGVAWMMPAAVVGMLNQPVRSPHWGRYVVEIEVPETAHSVVIGLALVGNGTGWFGDLELEHG